MKRELPVKQTLLTGQGVGKILTVDYVCEGPKIEGRGGVDLNPGFNPRLCSGTLMKQHGHAIL